MAKDATYQGPRRFNEEEHTTDDVKPSASDSGVNTICVDEAVLPGLANICKTWAIQKGTRKEEHATPLSTEEIDAVDAMGDLVDWGRHVLLVTCCHHKRVEVRRANEARAAQNEHPRTELLGSLAELLAHRWNVEETAAAEKNARDKEDECLQKLVAFLTLLEEILAAKAQAATINFEGAPLFDQIVQGEERADATANDENPSPTSCPFRGEEHPRASDEAQSHDEVGYLHEILEPMTVLCGDHHIMDAVVALLPVALLVRHRKYKARSEELNANKSKS